MQDAMFKLSVGLNANWPDGKPLRSEVLGDGKVLHTLEDGRRIMVSEPTYRVDYLSTWLGAAPDETYEIDVAFIGLSLTQGFYEVWNFEISEVRNYSFLKTKRVVDLKTGEEFTSLELQNSLGKATK